MNDLFPLDIAENDAFFDRDQERKRLHHNISTNTHSLITSPRRYGKTSLVRKVLKESTVIYANMDMMLASDIHNMKTVILNGIAQVVSQIVSKQDKLQEMIKKIFVPFTMIESVELGFIKIRFHSYSNTLAPHIIVLEALEKLEKLAEQLKLKIVLFFDEYQHVLSIEGVLDFERAMRSFAQTAKYVTFIFSGSNRHILQAMFDDDTRPFYNMCDHILLGRIPRDDFAEHIQQLSQKKWSKTISDEALNLIFTYTARHTYYVNALCRRLWQQDKLPDVEAVKHEWEQLASEKRYEINRDFENLTPIQRTILIELAHDPFIQPTSKAVLQRIRASTSGITNALDGLLKHDHVFIDDQNKYRILNPLTEYILWQATADFYDK
jgi:hypothetical protein